MRKRLGHVAYWGLITLGSLGMGLGLYLFPGIAEMESMEAAMQAETLWGRLEMALPTIVLALLLAPGTATIVYKGGRQIQLASARNAAVTAGLLLSGGAFSGVTLFLIGKQTYLLPFWVLFHLSSHQFTPAAAPACPFC